MEETGTLDEVFFGYEPSSSARTEEDKVIVMRRRYRRDLTPEEAHQMFLRWFSDSFLPWMDDVQAGKTDT